MPQLQEHTFVTLLPASWILLVRIWRGFESSHYSLIEDILQLELCERGALYIFDCAQFFGHALAVLSPDRLHLLFGKLVSDLRVVS